MIKKILLTLCFTVWWMYGFAQTKTTSYTITGNIEGLTNGTEIKLIPLDKGSTKAIATTTVQNGIFTFKGKISEPTLVYLTTSEFYYGKALVLTNTKIQIKGKAVSMNDKAFNLTQVNVIGSPLTDLFYQKLSVRENLNKLYKECNENNKEISDLMGKARMAKNKTMQDSIQKTDAWKKLEKEENNFMATVQTTYNKLFEDNKDSFFGPLMVLYLSNYITPDMKDIYNKFTNKAKNSLYGKMLKKELFPEGLVGKKALDFKVKDANGKELFLADFLKGKKYLLIDFWASWCNPCRKEIPNLKAQYKLYADKGFQIVSISTDREETAWKKAVGEEQFTWPNFRDTTGEIANTYRIKFIPMLYLMDSTGKIIAENIRGEVLANKLKELMP